MKKVLVTGAAGNIGINVIKYLLAEGKYDITAIDLPNKYVYNRLRKYRKRINIIYGDILDGNTVYELIKDQDFIIHLASCLPPLADLKEKLANTIEVTGTENIVRAINYCNKKCMLVYASSTSVYGVNSPVSVDLKTNPVGFYSMAKVKAEGVITKHLKNYAILRISLVIGDLINTKMIYSVPSDEMVECISSEDAAYALVKCLDKKDDINKKILNIGGGDNCTILFKDLKKMILNYHGINLNNTVQSMFITKNYHSPVLIDSIESNKILDYQNDSFESISMKVKRRSKKRVINRLFGKLFAQKKKKGGKK